MNVGFGGVAVVKLAQCHYDFGGFLAAEIYKGTLQHSSPLHAAVFDDGRCRMV